MGNSSSQILGTQQSQSQELSQLTIVEPEKAPHTLPTPTKELAQKDATLSTPPPTAHDVDLGSDRRNSRSSVEADKQAEELIVGDGATFATPEESSPSDLPAAPPSPTPYLSEESVATSLESASDFLPDQFTPTMSDSPDQPRATPTEEERLATAERIRDRDERRAKKQSRRLQRSLGQTSSQLASSAGRTLDAPSTGHTLLVPDTQPEAPDVIAEEELDTRTPKAQSEREASFDPDDPGTQLRMEAERARTSQQAATQEASSPLKRREEQQPERKKRKLKRRRKAESPETQDAPVESPGETRPSKKRALELSEGGEEVAEEPVEPAPKKAKAKSKSRKGREVQAEDQDAQQMQSDHGRDAEDHVEKDLVEPTPEESRSKVKGKKKRKSQGNEDQGPQQPQEDQKMRVEDEVTEDPVDSTPVKAKSTRKSEKSHDVQVKENEDTRQPQSDEEEVAARSPDSSPPTKTPFKQPRMLTTDPPSGPNEIDRTKKEKPRRKSAGRLSIVSNDGQVTGPFTAEEIAKVKKGVSAYCIEHDISDEQFRELLQPSSERGVPLNPNMPAAVAASRSAFTHVVNSISEDLRDRPRKSIRRFLQRKYSTAHRAPWKAEEDDDLREAYQARPNNWVYIAQQLGRLAEDCRDRWRDHVGNPLKHDGIWTPEEETGLERAVAECVSRMAKERNQEYPGEVDDVGLEVNINWTVVSDMLGKTRNRLQCFNKWTKLQERKARNGYGGTPTAGTPWRSKSANVTPATAESGWVPTNSATPASSKKPKRPRQSDGADSSAPRKKSRKSSASMSSKTYKSAERITAEDDEDEIEDGSQLAAQSDTDGLKIFDVPQSPIPSRRPHHRQVEGRLKPVKARKSFHPIDADAADDRIQDSTPIEKPQDTKLLDEEMAGALEPEEVNGTRGNRSEAPIEPAPASFASSPPELVEAIEDVPATVPLSPTADPIARRTARPRAPNAEQAPYRPESPVTSSIFRPRTRTPPEDKNWLPGDQYLMLHELHTAWSAGRFHNLNSYMATIRARCGEEHYTAEDRITTYWKLVHEGGFKQGLRDNIHACIELLAKRHANETWRLALTSHGEVVYPGTDLGTHQRSTLETTPPMSGYTDFFQRYARDVESQAAQGGAARSGRELRGQGQSAAPFSNVRERDLRINRECESAEVTRAAREATAQAQQPQESNNDTSLDKAVQKLKASAIDTTGWSDWKIAAIARKRLARELGEGPHVEHPTLHGEWRAMSQDEKRFHLLKHQHERAGTAGQISDDRLWELARAHERERAIERTGKEGPSGGVEKAAPPVSSTANGPAPQAVQRAKLGRVHQWSQDVVERMERGDLQSVPSPAVPFEEPTQSLLAARAVTRKPNDQDYSAPTQQGPVEDDDDDVVLDTQQYHQRQMNDLTGIEAGDNNDGTLLDELDGPPHSISAGSDSEQRVRHGDDPDARSQASVELGSIRMASPELGELAADEDAPEQQHQQQQLSTMTARRESWQSSLPDGFKDTAKTPPTSSAVKKGRTYSRKEKGMVH